MAVDISGFHDAHGMLQAGLAEIRALAVEFPDLDVEERRESRTRVLRYLREEVDPHTKLDERLLYPAVAERLGDPLVAVSMSYDHLAIRHWISEIAAADVSRTEHFQQLLYGLDAIVRMHIWKENELFLAVLESSWPGELSH